MREYPLLVPRTFNESYLKAMDPQMLARLIKDLVKIGAGFDSEIAKQKEKHKDDGEEHKYQNFPFVPLYGAASKMKLTFQHKPGQLLFIAQYQLRALVVRGLKNKRDGLLTGKVLKEFGRNTSPDHKSNAHIKAFLEGIYEGDLDEKLAASTGLDQKIEPAGGKRGGVKVAQVQELLQILWAPFGKSSIESMKHIRYYAVWCGNHMFSRVARCAIGCCGDK